MDRYVGTTLTRGGGSSVFLNNRIIGIAYESLIRIPLRLGIVAGVLKAEAVLGAIRGRFVNALVVDEQLAEKLLTVKAAPAQGGNEHSSMVGYRLSSSSRYQQNSSIA